MTTVIDIPPMPAAIPALPGSTETVRAFAADLLATSSALDDLASFAGNVRHSDYWQGDAAEAYGAAARDSADDADAKSLVLRKVSGQVDDFADEMDAFERRRLDLYERRNTLSSRRIDLITDVNGAGEATDAEVEALQSRAHTLSVDLRVLHEDHEALLREVQAAGTRMIAAFQAVDTQSEVRQAGDTMTDPADAAFDLPGSPTDEDSSPEQVNAWWDGLTEEQQLAVIAARPELVGNANGIPTAARDQANRISLDLDLDRLETREEDGDFMSFDERRELERARAAQDALDDVASREDPVTGDPVPGYLTLYDPTAFDGDGAVAVSVGDPDTADNVSVSVPGMLNDGSTIPGGTDSVFNLYSAARASDPSSTVASTMWIGYDGPSNFGVHGLDTFQVVSDGLAEEGGNRLADYLDGVRATRADGLDPAHLTAVGHSYGSTTLGHAATDHDIPVDDIVVIGSPGLGDADSASDLGIDSDHVWVGANSEDPVSGLARNGWVGTGLGLDPADEDFGANRFRAEDVDRDTGEGMFYNHNQYYRPDSESLFNMGQIVAGNDDQVLGADQRYDPWWRTMVDPEDDRTPEVVPTGYDR